MAEKKDEDWDDLLGEAKQSGITPEMARTLLSMNPKLREEGKNTQWVIANNQKATAQAPAAAAAAAKPSATKADGDALSQLDDLHRRYESDEKQALAQLKAIEDARVQNKAHMLDAVMRMLVGKDPELLSPVTQQALADKKAFLDRLGFSVKGFLEFKRRAGKR